MRQKLQRRERKRERELENERKREKERKEREKERKGGTARGSFRHVVSNGANRTSPKFIDELYIPPLTFDFPAVLHVQCFSPARNRAHRPDIECIYPLRRRNYESTILPRRLFVSLFILHLFTPSRPRGPRAFLIRETIRLNNGLTQSVNSLSFFLSLRSSLHGCRRVYSRQLRRNDDELRRYVNHASIPSLRPVIIAKPKSIAK